MELDVGVGGSNPLWLLLLLFSVLAVAFFSSSEASLLYVNKFRVRHLAERGSKGAQAVDRVMERHEKFFAAILLTENAFIILASSVGTALAISYLGRGGTSVLIATAVMTVLIVAFGEITPKSLAARFSDRWAPLIARPIEIIMALETFILYLFTLLPRAITRLMAKGGAAEAPSVTEGELRMLIDLAHREGVVERVEAEMLEKVFHFGDWQVREIMTPRTEIVWVEKNTTLEEFLRLYGQETHTRFPVFEESMDNVTGAISVKDLLQAMAEGKLQPQDSVTQRLRSVHFVPETKLVGQLFSELRRQGQQMAIVVDEFGGVAGLVTLKQLMEVIVGPVGEEGEPAEEEFIAIDEYTYSVDASMGIAEANERLSLQIPEGDYQTVAGFILEQLGRIPQVGDHFHYQGLRWEVKEMEGVKLERVEVRRVGQPIGQGGA